MKFITVPKDKIAEEALDYNEAAPEQLIEITIEDEDFKPLWNSGFFNQINLLLGTIIDDYEDDAITAARDLKTVLDNGIFEREEFKDQRFVPEIKQLFKEALERNTGVYFFF